MRGIYMQIPLPFTLPDYATWEAIYAGPNQMAVHDLRAFSAGEGETFVFVAGELGTGKTVLLQTVCQAVHKRHQVPIYLPLAEVHLYGPAVLEELAQYPYVCIDDLELVVGQGAWEEAVFVLFNEMRTRGHHLLIAADQVPAQLGVQLPDLRSRLQSGLVCSLKRLDDSEWQAALQNLAAYVGLALPDEVAQFLLRRLPRTMDQLYQTFNTLNAASLAEQRKLTIPFVKSVLAV